MYRSGSSGDGVSFVNRYDVESQTWERALDQPLFSGHTPNGSMNAYPVGMRMGPDGSYHIFWVWRDSPDVATNHDICYLRTRDFEHFTTSSGEPIELPVVLARAEVVEPAPTGSGLNNWGDSLSFDAQGRPMLTYIRYDEQGHNQVYALRRTDQGWQRRQLTAWTARSALEGHGSIDLGVSWSRLELSTDGASMTLRYQHRNCDEQRMRRHFDAETLEPIGEPEPVHSPWPAELDRQQGEDPRLKVHQRLGPQRERDGDLLRSMLRWETLPSNRDRPQEPVPPPAKLECYELIRER